VTRIGSGPTAAKRTGTTPPRFPRRSRSQRAGALVPQTYALNFHVAQAMVVEGEPRHPHLRKKRLSRWELRDGAIRMVRGSRIEQPEIDAATAQRDNGRMASFDNSMGWIFYRPAGQRAAVGNGERAPATYDFDWTASDVPCASPAKAMTGASLNQTRGARSGVAEEIERRLEALCNVLRHDREHLAGRGCERRPESRLVARAPQCPQRIERRSLFERRSGLL